MKQYWDSNNWPPSLPPFPLAAGAPAGTIIDGGVPGSLGNNVFPFPGVMVYNDGGDETSPKAYLNYLVFDRNYLYKTGGYKRISTAAKEDGQNATHERLAFDGTDAIVIKEPGVCLYLVVQ